jgi:hypothetical protein
MVAIALANPFFASSPRRRCGTQLSAFVENSVRMFSQIAAAISGSRFAQARCLRRLHLPSRHVLRRRIVDGVQWNRDVAGVGMKNVAFSFYEPGSLPVLTSAMLCVFLDADALAVFKGAYTLTGQSFGRTLRTGQSRSTSRGGAIDSRVPSSFKHWVACEHRGAGASQPSVLNVGA